MAVDLARLLGVSQRHALRLANRHLERFLGTEVSEQAALGEPGGLREAADGEAGYADHVRELERAREDRLPGFFSLRH